MTIRVALVFFAVLIASARAQAQEPLIVGVTDVGAAVKELPAHGAVVRRAIGISRAVAVTGDAERLRRLPFVRYVEADPPDAVWIVAETLDYGVANIDAEVVWGGAQNATSVIPGQGGLGARVAVIDTGIDCAHEDLAAGCIYGANFVTSALPFDDHGHGTHVAGTIAARANGIGVIGVAPEATVYAVKVLSASGSGSWSGIAAGIDWAVANGMDVINMSLGGSSYSQAVADAVAAADAAGVLIVAAAGNSGCCNTVGYPAKLPAALAVAAVDQFDMRASFSSTGPEVDITAPGVAVRATVPTGTCSLCDPSGYRALSGTSMATPHVAGVAALLMSRGRTAGESWTLLTATAKDLGPAGRDDQYGAGRVDALAAVQGGAGDPPPPPPQDSTAPVVAVTNPAEGATVVRRSTITITAGASDDVGVVRVEFFVNGSAKCSDVVAPFACVWKVPGSGGRTHYIEARAFDAAGNVAVHWVSVTSR